MSKVESCPNPEAMRNLIEHGGPDAEIEVLASHLEQCEACGQAMDTLLGVDSTVADLQSGKMIQIPSGPVLEELKSKLHGLKPVAATALEQNQTLLFAVQPDAKPTTPPTSAQDLTEAFASFLAPSERADEIGRLGNYRILKQLGAGGMGMVFLAEDIQLRRRVALKTLLPALASNDQARERFLREARAMAAVEHEHIIAIHQVGEDRGVPFLAMPLLKGEALDVRLRSGPVVPRREAVRIAAEMAEGLAAAHEHGLIHRDIKPGNVWLEGERGRVKLLDFGLARAQLDDVQLTHSGTIVGTPAFMAPEQAQGNAIDGRADLFSLGAVLYAMLTGRRPFEGASTMAILTALALKEPPSPNSINAEIPADLSQLTMRLLAKNRDQRPETARQVASDLREWLRADEQPPALIVPSGAVPGIASPSVNIAAKPPKPSRRKLIAFGLLSAGALLAAILMIRLPSKDGELVLEADADQIEVTIKQAGKEPVVVVVDKNSKRTVELKAANGTIEARELPDGLRFKTQTFELTSDKRKVLTATMLLAMPDAVAAKSPKPDVNMPVGLPNKVEAAAVASEYVETAEFTAWKQEITKLPAPEQLTAVLMKLQELNPGFDGKAKHKYQTEGNVVTELELHTDSVIDISPLRALTGLVSLNLTNGTVGDSRKGVVDLAPLAILPLRKMVLIGRRVFDLAPLRGLKLTSLKLNRTRVTDLSPLKDMPLQTLDCDESPYPEFTLAALNVLQSIKTLETAFGRRMVDLQKERPAMEAFINVVRKLRRTNPNYDGAVQRYKIINGQLAELHLNAPGLNDFSALATMKSLSVLILSRGSYWRPANIAALSELKLAKLGLSGCEIDDLSPFRGLPLTELDISHTHIRDLSPLKAMPLESLTCIDTPLSDGKETCELLRSIPSLKTFNGKPLAEFVGDPDAVAELDTLLQQLSMANPGYQRFVRSRKLENGHVVELALNDDALTHFSALRTLPALTTLNLGRGHEWRLKDWTFLQGMKLTSLNLTGAQIEDLTLLKGMPLTELDLSHLKVAPDLSSLQGLPLKKLTLNGKVPVTDLSPLATLPLVEIRFEAINPERDAPILKTIATLKTINGKPADRLWSKD